MRNLCTVDGCKALVLGNGLCKLHYHRQRRKGHTGDERKNARQRCTVDGCEAWRVGFGLCDRHYRQQRAGLAKEALLRSKEGRACAWCGDEIPRERRRNALFCDAACKRHSLNERARQRPGHAHRLRVYHYDRKFGITVERYDELLAAQGGLCAICGTDEPGGKYGTFHVDHCHQSSAVRGLLCTSCNTGLGHFKDDPERLAAAIRYLNQ